MNKLRDLIVLFNDVKNTKTKRRYFDLLDFTINLINDYLINEHSNIEKTILISIVNEILTYNSPYPCEEKRKIVKDKISLVKVYIKDLDDLINCMLISKVDKDIVVGSGFYNNAYELYYDLKSFILNKNKAKVRVRNQVNAYIYYIAGSVLEEISKYNIEIEECDKSLIWILNQIVKEDVYINASECVNNGDKIDYREHHNLYLKLVNYNQ